MESFAYLVGMAGTVAFAVTAVLALAPMRIDLFGACVLGVITAIGGGTVRDLILDVPVFWAGDLTYIWVALGASILVFFGQSLFSRKLVSGAMLYTDGLGAALFGIEATDKVWQLGFGLPLAPVLLGVVTAIGGGLIRDLLAGRQTLLMKRELYAVPVLIGCVLYTGVLHFAHDHRFSGAIACVLVVFLIRSAAIRYNLSVPDWLTTGTRDDH